MRIAVLGAGAFGTALAIALARGGRGVTLWARDPAQADALARTRENAARLPGQVLPDSVAVTDDKAAALAAEILLLAMPMQALAGFLADAGPLRDRVCVACCKGVDLDTGLGPSGVIAAAVPDTVPALLSGPSFATDIAAGLPTALTLGIGGDGQAVQRALSTETLRIYTSDDLVGVELGGALKNVIAIACGISIGAGLGESARAALMTRGYAEIVRFATAKGARADTLAGLSGLGDLALTCASDKSRNYAYGLRLGQAGRAEATATTEGIATARAVADIARAERIDLPVTQAIAAVLDGSLDVAEAVRALMARPLRAE